MPITSAAVERIFSIFIAMNRENRQRFTFDNLRKFVIDKCILQKVCFDTFVQPTRLCCLYDLPFDKVKICCHLQKFNKLQSVMIIINPSP